jgi:hypothetical protein
MGCDFCGSLCGRDHSPATRLDATAVSVTKGGYPSLLWQENFRYVAHLAMIIRQPEQDVFCTKF